ncbi:MAG: heavy metal translocating P-type ATPase [Xanthomonadales bacterium]|nr:heavy metal translocating P-type ATPase [Xanthomonadales bacterium]
MTEQSCFHCGDPVPAGCTLTVEWEGQAQPMCCPGCQAVADLIISGGQGDYYRFRDSTAARADESILQNLSDWDAFDSEAEQVDEDGTVGSLVLVGGIHCSACGWLIENQLHRIDGVSRVQVDTMTRRVQVNWAPDKTGLPAILKKLASLGYRPRPMSAEAGRDLNREEKRTAIRRLGVAGLGMMQVMMYAVGTYFGPMGDMEPAMERYLHLVSMLVATPVLVFSGAPFFTGAWRAIRTRHPNMDLPVAIALALAFSSSCYNLYVGHGSVYFESVTMFVFFLLLGRFVEMSVRHRSCGTAEGLAQVLPETARVESDGEIQSVPRSALTEGQQVHVRPGDAFAADGVLLEPAEIDESLLTGESTPCLREPGERVLAGSVNLGSATRLEVTATGDELLVSQLERLLRRARAERPVWIRMADAVASWVIAFVLLLAGGVYLVWSWIDPSQAFEAALAVLVVTCPCALSLAVPSALAAAGARLGRGGLLVSNTGALMDLARVEAVLFDKTGTLTRGRPQITETWVNTGHPAAVSQDRLLALVGAVEDHVSHPIARAFQDYQYGLQVDQVRLQPGQGVVARVEGRSLQIGSAELAGADAPQDLTPPRDGIVIYVSDQQGFLGRIVLKDLLRPEAAGLVQSLGQLGIGSHIVSGDRESAVAAVGEALSIAACHGALRPEQKLAVVRQLQAENRRVLAVGDGVNDAPVLGGADVSIAMVEGAGLAQAGADMVLTGGRLDRVGEAVKVARKMMSIIKQNLAWALGYNLIAIPLAAMGLVAPWMAAIGMSLSSLVVVINAGRAGRIAKDRSDTDSHQAAEAWA